MKAVNANLNKKQQQTPFIRKQTKPTYCNVICLISVSPLALFTEKFHGRLLSIRVFSSAGYYWNISINVLAFYHEWRPLIGHATRVLFKQWIVSVAKRPKKRSWKHGHRLIVAPRKFDLLKVVGNSFPYFPRLTVWHVIISTLLTVDAIIMVSTNCPIIGKQVAVNFVAQ